MLEKMSNPILKTQNLIMIISGPSGSGKTSLTKKLLNEDRSLKPSVSVTTRHARAGEVEGVDYYFTDINNFTSKIAQHQMLEFTKIHDNYYGTPKEHVDNLLHAGYDILFDIDTEGAKSIKAKLGDMCFSVFVLPPSLAELEMRLAHRSLDSSSSIASRIHNAKSEIMHATDHDYIIENIDLEIAYEELKSILVAERLKKHRKLELNKYLEKFLVL